MFLHPDRHFSTQNVHAGKRLGAWREMVSDVFYNVDIDVDRKGDGDWLASISEVRLQNLSISHYATDSARGTRNRPLMAADRDEFYIFVFPMRGTMYFNQYARDGIVRPGEYVMLRSSDFYKLCCDEHFDGVFLKVSARVVDEAYRMASSHCSNWRPANTVLSRILLSEIFAISDLTSCERESFASSLLRQVLSMIVLMLQTEEGEENRTSAARHGLYRRLKHLIELRYHDEGFDPSSAATELRVSLGYMHRCAKAHGTSFSQLLRETRLARSYEMLQQPAARRQVGEVANLNGFSDHSVFSKAFKQRYGKTPTELQLENCGHLATREWAPQN